MTEDAVKLLKTLDSSKQCDLIGHQFSCAKLEGERGELVMIKKVLSGDEISRLTQNPSLSSEICPDGQILCSRCHVSLSGEKPENLPLPVVEKQNFFK